VLLRQIPSRPPTLCADTLLDVAEPARNTDDKPAAALQQVADEQWPAPPRGRWSRAWWYVTVRHRHNWAQFLKFSVVGASGYVVNLVVFTAVLQLQIGYLLAAVVAFAIANVNNYLWNRYWAFPRADHSMLFEYVRFLSVGLLSLGGNLVLLHWLIDSLGWLEVAAQAVAVAVVTPIGFLGNKLFTFRTQRGGWG
jgi:dolichol-phosphate mannosyltransferase